MVAFSSYTLHIHYCFCYNVTLISEQSLAREFPLGLIRFCLILLYLCVDEQTEQLDAGWEKKEKNNNSHV